MNIFRAVYLLYAALAKASITTGSIVNPTMELGDKYYAMKYPKQLKNIEAGDIRPARCTLREIEFCNHSLFTFFFT